MEIDEDNSLDLEEGELVEESTNVVPEEERKILRAKRFGFNNKNETSPTSNNPSLHALHKRMGVDKNTRTEALHLLGTENMKTDDVFAYFSSSSPATVEWLTENSCNATWLDEESCAKALVKHSIFIRDQPGAPPDLEDEEEYVNLQDVRMALPPGIWRKGQFFSLAPNLIIRYAKFSDKKQHFRNHMQSQPEFRRNKVFLDEGDEVSKKIRVDTGNGNPWVNIAMQWGDYEYRVQQAASVPPPVPRIRDAREVLNKRANDEDKISNTRRIPLPYDDIDEEDDDQEKEIHIPREPTMQADIEEEKLLKQKLHTFSLAHGKIDLRNRLVRKRNLQGTQTMSRKRSIEDDIRLTLKTIQNKSSKHSSRRDWESSSESEDDREQEREKERERDSSRDLRKKLQKSSHKESSHKKCKLRSSKSKTKKFVPSPLRIEIDNDIYFENENQD